MTLNRRHFLQTSTGAALASRLLSAQATRRISANDHIQAAIIGLGGQGTGDIRASLAQPGVKLVAVADVYDGRRDHAKEVWGADLFTTRDYREVLARPDVDMVIIATPDHWHSTITIEALGARKDVYCEKPMVQLIPDGMPVVEASRRSDRIIQIGSQRVSSILYAKARDLYRQGAIGELNMIEAWYDRNSAIGAWQYSIPPDASAETVDWDRFLGRAPKRPFDAKRIFRWRNYRDYGTGVAGDLFVHLFSGIHFVLDSIGPERVYATGGLRFWKDGRDVPDVMLGLFDYPKTDSHPAFNMALRVDFVDGATETSGFRFVGSEGIMTIGSNVTLSRHPRESEPGYTINTFTEAMQREYMDDYLKKYPKTTATADSMRPDADEKFLPPHGYDDHLDHHRKFIESVRSRKPAIEDAVFGFRAAAPALLSNVSYFEHRVCQWDPKGMREISA
jgi:predicted dehydrogenase